MSTRSLDTLLSFTVFELSPMFECIEYVTTYCIGHLGVLSAVVYSAYGS